MAAEQPPEGPSRRPHRGWWVATGLLSLLLVVGLAVLWIKAPALYGRGDAAKTAAATTRGAILTVAAVLIAATAAGAGLYMTARTLAETQRANREADQRDRYAKSIEQLGSDKLDVRLGGIYGLERIAETSERDQRTVVEVLSAFIHEHSRPTTSRMLPLVERSRMQAAEHPSARARQDRAAPPRPTTDVRAALTVLGRLPARPDVPRADLTNVQLPDADLNRVILSGARLVEADLSAAENLTQQQLDSAHGDENTKLPAGLQRPAHWSAGGGTATGSAD